MKDIFAFFDRLLQNCKIAILYFSFSFFWSSFFSCFKLTQWPLIDIKLQKVVFGARYEQNIKFYQRFFKAGILCMILLPIWLWQCFRSFSPLIWKIHMEIYIFIRPKDWVVHYWTKISEGPQKFYPVCIINNPTLLPI